MHHLARIAGTMLALSATVLPTGCGPGGDPHVGLIVEGRLAGPLSEAIAPRR